MCASNYFVISFLASSDTAPSSTSPIVGGAVGGVVAAAAVTLVVVVVIMRRKYCMAQGCIPFIIQSRAFISHANALALRDNCVM